MSSIEFTPGKTFGAAGYTPINDSYHTTISSEQSAVSCFNKSVKQTVPLYFSAGTSNNKTTVVCQFNDLSADLALKERGQRKIDAFNAIAKPFVSKKDRIEAGLPEVKVKKSAFDHNKIISITFSEHLTKDIISELKETLIKLNILDITNIEALESSIQENHETSNYQTFKQISRISQNKLTFTGIQSFPYENIISLADGEYFLEGTAFKIKNFTHNINNNIRITSADLPSINRSCIYITCYGTSTLFSPKEIKKYSNIKIINLDNTLPFTTQLQKPTQKKYDLIVMRKGLCMCHEDFTCGGIQPSKKGSLYGLLTNVASIIDTSKSHSLAVLTGKNSDYSIGLWDEEIQQFNIDNQGKLVAETVRDRAGIFRGITIKLVNPGRQNFKRCSIL